MGCTELCCYMVSHLQEKDMLQEKDCFVLVPKRIHKHVALHTMAME